MAVRANTKASRARDRASAADRKNSATPEIQDAIALLEADHREVDGLFAQYETLDDAAERKTVADKICLALKVHAQIEEELFYPAARQKTGDDALLDEALVEHMGAKSLIAQIEAMKPGMPLYDARVSVLGEQIRHHVREEEDELFPEVRGTDLDLDALGKKLAARKSEVMAILAQVG